jgi:HD-GYP domain-containing protein (c-di-GMP phosphodiesterase class II)
MTRAELFDLKKWFRIFVRGYKTADRDLRRNVNLKVKHTMNVCREIRRISKALSLSESDQILAESIALLHDVGRFEQYARYRTFADSRSENHAELGLTLLSRERVLEGLAPDEADLVVRAIAYHNRATLPRDESEESALFSNLLRDADKLDIWRLVIEYYHQAPEERNEAVAIGYEEAPGISASVAQPLLKRQSVDRVDVRNLNDFKLLHIGWVYDLNFKPTYRAVRRRRYVQSIAETLPQSPEVNEIVSIALTHVASMCGGEGQTLPTE